MSTKVGDRAYFIDDYAEEWMPCQPTLEGWAAWLAAPDGEAPEELPAKDGQVFEGSALLFRENIVATFEDGNWHLSRDPDEEGFLAIRYCEDGGWTFEDIVNATREDLLDHLTEFGEDLDSPVYVAAATYEQWRFTFRAGEPPQLLAERVQ